jgi:hypothetical protein
MKMVTGQALEKARRTHEDRSLHRGQRRGERGECGRVEQQRLDLELGRLEQALYHDAALGDEAAARRQPALVADVRISLETCVVDLVDRDHVHWSGLDVPLEPQLEPPSWRASTASRSATPAAPSSR